MNRNSLCLVLGMLMPLQACVADNTMRIGDGIISFEVLEQNRVDEFSMIVRGSGNNTQAEVIEAFNIKAKELCKKESYLLDYVVEPLPSNMVPSSSSHPRKAFKATGTVNCKAKNGI